MKQDEFKGMDLTPGASGTVGSKAREAISWLAGPPEPAGSKRYSRNAIVLHWMIAVLVLSTIPLGLYGASFDTPTGQLATDIHKPIGILILALTLVRIGWRLTHKPPALPDSCTTTVRRVAKVTHLVFYALLLILPLSGWWMSSAVPVRHPIAVGALHIPFLPVPRGWASAGPAHAIHVNLAWLMIGLAVLHILAALKHRFVDRDEVLARMTFADLKFKAFKERTMSEKKPTQGRGPLPQKFPHEPERIRKGAEILVQMRRKEIELQGEEGLPEDARPRNRDEAQQMNDLVIDLLGWPVLGWKFYINATIQQAPLRTPIYHIWQSPAALTEEASQHRWIEPELAFRALRDFPAREKPYSYHDILDGFEAVPVFEIIGPRFRFDSAAHMRQVVNGYRINPRFDGLADGNASGGYVVGSPVKDWQDLDWLKMRVTMDAGTVRLVDTVGGHPLVDPFISMFPLVNMMREREGIKAGMLMATHSYSGFIPVPADEKVVSTFSFFDPIEAIFTSSK